jgi:hypothetical protein
VTSSGLSISHLKKCLPRRKANGTVRDNADQNSVNHSDIFTHQPTPIQQLLLYLLEQTALISKLQATLKDDITINEKTEKNIKADRAFSTFGFAQHTSRPFAKPKELNFSQRTENKNINFDKKIL